MALKRKIDKAAWDKLKPDVQFEYKKDGEDYLLDTDGDEDTGALKRAKDRETQRRVEAEEALEAVTAERDTLKKNRTGNDKDVERLTAAHERKLGETVKEWTTRVEKLTGQLSKVVVDGTATQLASKLSNAPGLLKPHILSRLQPDFSGDDPTVIVLGPDGKPGKHADGKAWTIEDLSKELVANKEYSAIMLASKASGGGAPNRTFTTPAAGGPNPQATVPLAKYSPQEMAAKITADRAAKAS